ncbi:alpha/beta hydrolase [Tsukamurella tyrosinosolvens]|uniref:alpha/beta fold hydrolase n=1 Tax=Tsukamurella tyrosinosolvens TaxID=57704 RepID=UPI001AF8B83D|nr:alpha/beta hydrolase [Tsukamurella tyrosinosolvens]QRY83638.1 alpha/beta hydrolase [Tsukamurella tyrosinosolvens]
MTGGLPVVLLHGWPVTDLHWRHLAPRLRAAGFDPLPITLPGFGSGADGGTDFRKSALAARVSARLAAAGIARCAVVGHDWGGTVAVHLAAAAPETVSALVVEEEVLPGIDVAVPAPGSEHYPDWHGAFNRAPGLAESLVPGREDDFYGAFLRESAGPAGLDPAVLGAYVDAYRPTDVHVAGLAHYRTRADDLADVDELRTHPVRTPALAIGGRFAMGTAVAEGLRPVASDVRGAVLPESGHYPAEQEPERTADVVIDFLRRHAGP